MLNVFKIALGPLLILQGRRLRATALRLPEAEGARNGVVGDPGNLPILRILFVGDSSAAGVGVDHQDSALAMQTAALVAERIGITVEWQLVAKSGVNTNDALSLLSTNDLRPADLLVTALGVNDVTSQRSPRQFLADYKALVNEVARRVGARTVVVNGVPPLHVATAVPQPLRWYLGQYARRLDACLRHWASSNGSLSYVSLQWGSCCQGLGA